VDQQSSHRSGPDSFGGFTVPGEQAPGAPGFGPPPGGRPTASGRHPTGAQPVVPRPRGPLDDAGKPGAPARGPQTNRTRTWVLAAAVLVLVLVAGAVYLLTSGRPNDDEGSDSVPATLNVGDSVDLRNAYGDRVTITIRSAESKKSCGESARKPETGSYLVADVVVEVKAGRATVKATDFDFAPSEGGWPHRDIGPDFTGCGGAGLGVLDNIGTGQRHEGRLVFDVAGSGRIVYHVSTGTNPFGAQWTVG
jgi:hypothetical protein